MKSNHTIIRELPCSQIQAGSNDRTTFEHQKLLELATSISKNGLAQPITVRPVGDVFEIVAGERRFRAVSQILQWDTIACLVRELSDEEASAIMLTENTGRVDLDVIAEATAYSVRRDKFGWSVAKIAETAGVGAQRVKDRLLLLSLAEDVQHFVRTSAFPLGHALSITDLDVNRQRIALRVYNAAHSMSLSRFKEIVAELRAQQIEEGQLDMFATLFIAQQVPEAAAVKKGKRARTGAPSRKDIPAVRWHMKDTMGSLLDRYIADLLRAGHAAEAATIGTVYNTLVSLNWTSVPDAPELKAAAAETAEILAHAVQMQTE